MFWLNATFYKTYCFVVNRIAFIYLTGFSKTGGIEKFNKNVLASFKELNTNAVAYSVYDDKCDEKYVNSNQFKGFGSNKILFSISIILNAKKYDTLLIGHINLSFVAYFVKLINPTIQLILIAHGIEVWGKQKGKAEWLLRSANLILAVSNFTKHTLQTANPFVNSKKIKLLPNALDPYFVYPSKFEKPAHLLAKYNLSGEDKILLTVSRLSSEEQYKGYDRVIRSINDLSLTYPSIKYLIVGNADEVEQQRVSKLIQEEKVHDHVILTGFIEENELIDHYLLADVFVLPSKGEGFGIVLIEAMACGVNVIAGYKDGSVDALMNGELGTLIDPDNQVELIEEILNILDQPKFDSFELQKKVKEHFDFPVFKKNLNNILASLNLKIS